jgi:hypothetical protein
METLTNLLLAYRDAILTVFTWCTENLMVVLTAIYVFATIKMLKSMNKTNQLTTDIEKEKSRPYVIFDIEIRDDFGVYLTLENIGKTPAFDIQLEVKPGLVKRFGSKRNVGIGFIDNGIKFLSPKRKLCDLIDSTLSFYEKKELHFSGEVTYRDKWGDSYKENYSIDLESFRDISEFTKKDKVEERLGKIEKHLKDISITLKNVTLNKRPIEQVEKQEDGKFLN